MPVVPVVAGVKAFYTVLSFAAISITTIGVGKGVEHAESVRQIRIRKQTREQEQREADELKKQRGEPQTAPPKSEDEDLSQALVVVEDVEEEEDLNKALVVFTPEDTGMLSTFFAQFRPQIEKVVEKPTESWFWSLVSPFFLASRIGNATEAMMQSFIQALTDIANRFIQFGQTVLAVWVTSKFAPWVTRQVTDYIAHNRQLQLVRERMRLLELELEIEAQRNAPNRQEPEMDEATFNERYNQFIANGILRQ
jgi:flagellar biosynthesis protein FliQ